MATITELLSAVEREHVLKAIERLDAGAKTRFSDSRYPDNETFWRAAPEGRLLLMYCRACAQHYWYPRPRCPHCGGAQTEFREASGKGTVYSVSVTRRAGPTSYAIAYVTLDEGVTMMTNIVDCDLDAVRIGAAVELVFKPSDGGPPVPMFQPAGRAPRTARGN